MREGRAHKARAGRRATHLVDVGLRIEHGLLRKRGVYDDPRIHFAVNCASIGCPMLREEAYVPERLDAQLAGVD